MKYKIVIAVEGQFAECNNDPSSTTKIMRSYEIKVNTEQEARDIALKLRNNVFEEAEMVGTIETKFDPHVERMEE